MNRSFLFALLFSFCSIVAFAQNEADSHLKQFTTELFADKGSLSRFYTINSSPEKRERFQQFYTSCLNRLNAFDFENFSVGSRVDYLLTKKYLEDKLVKLEQEEKECAVLFSWFDFSGPIYVLEEKRRRGKYLEGKETASTLASVVKEIEKKSKKLKTQNPFLNKKLYLRSESVIKGQRKALKSVYFFYKDYDPDFLWWVEKPYALLDTTLAAYAAIFKSKIDSSSFPKDDGSGIYGNPVGRKELMRLLNKNYIPYAPEKLVDIALKEMAFCESEMKKAANEMGVDNWQDAFIKVKQAHVPVGKQPEAMLNLYNEAVDFLKINDLITIPPLAEESWRVYMISAKRQKTSPFFMGGEALQIAYPTHEMEHDLKVMSLKGNNLHFSKAVMHHELIAGHHLQQFMNARHNTHRFFGTPFWTEGWALYWELLLWDLNFAESPEDRMGMLFWRKHRCARIIFTLNYHLGKWTPQQCIDYLVEKVGHEKSTAEAEVRRSFTVSYYGPLYQLAYMTGGLQFYALKNELVDSGKMTLKEFHDAILHENAMPVELVRAILTKQSLAADFESEWRFFDDKNLIALHKKF